MNEILMIAIIVAVFLIVCVLLEAGTITAFKLALFRRAVLQSLLANCVSVTVIYFCWPLLSRMNIDEGSLFPLLPLLWGSVTVVEAMILMLLNKKQPVLRVLLTSAVMNASSFATLYIIFSLL